MADQEGDIFPQMEREICECFGKLFQMITERKELLLRKLHSLKEEFEKQNTSNRNKILQLASSKYELERMCQSLRGNQAVVQVEKGIADLEKEIRTVREEIRIPELSYHYSLNKLRECISQFGEIRDGQVRAKIECSDSNRASEIPKPIDIPRTNDKDPKDLFQARYNRNESGPSLFLPKPNMQQPSYGPYDPSGQKDPLYPIAPPVSQPYFQQMPPKEDYHPEFSRASVIPEPTECINILANMIICPVDSCRTLNLKRSFACTKCRMGLPRPGLGIVNPETSIIPGIIPVETWNCSQCTFGNTTTQGRPRICEACTTTNSMPGPVSPQPNPYHGMEYQPIDPRDRLHSTTKDKQSSFDQEPSVVYHELRNYPNPIPPVPGYSEFIHPGTNPPYRDPNPQPDPNLPYPGKHPPAPPMEPSVYPAPPPPPDNPPYKKIKHLISETHLTYKDEVLQLALEKCGIANAVHWLSTQFNNNITMLAENVRGQKFCDNATTEEVEDSYIECRGDMTQVAPRIQQARSRKLEELMKALDIDREMAVVELGKNNWEVMGALDNIILLNNQKYLGECRPRIWAGGMTVPEVPVDHFDEELWTQVKLLAENPQEMDSKMTRKLLCELKIPTLTQLNLLLQLVVSEETNDKEPKDRLQAVKEVSDYDSALRFLNQECEICMESYTTNDMIQMLYCPHSVCKDCYCAHFTNAVRNSAIKSWTCPVCSEPDIQQMEDPYYYFGLLSINIQKLCEGEIVKLFHQKVNEFAICKKPDIVIAIAAGVASQ